VLGRIRARTGTSMTLIAAGGIGSAQDAAQRLDAGATLLQAYTAFIYEGPLWPRRVHDGLAARSRRPISSRRPLLSQRQWPVHTALGV
jgi:dihydroorotate dehydrogenase